MKNAITITAIATMALATATGANGDDAQVLIDQIMSQREETISKADGDSKTEAVAKANKHAMLRLQLARQQAEKQNDETSITNIDKAIAELHKLIKGWGRLKRDIVLFDSFELKAPRIGGYPKNQLGFWNGDRTAVVANDKGISPFHGDKMLSFTGTKASGGTGASSCSILQIIDISKYNVKSGGVVAEAIGFFNRVHVDKFTDNKFTITLIARSGTANNKSPALVSTNANIYTDSNPETWECVIATLRLPPNTGTLSIELRHMRTRRMTGLLQSSLTGSMPI